MDLKSLGPYTAGPAPKYEVSDAGGVVCQYEGETRTLEPDRLGFEIA